ncbi:hypothetical protein LMG7974_00760 [Campylobacter majalis]|uniref:Porin family protein n=1 Tax=Campylobacter majalis TaxID=2790656 RepID=A0ABN7K5U1_9BACT|nr:hypothetical protein [Campylobacter majalis]CAD7287886.1 hypothetical protein LMG7974_00760 [Campylobacter majalis]
MLLKKFSIVAAVALVGVSLNAADLKGEVSLFGGIANTKNIANKNESKNAGTFELGYKTYQANGFVLDLNFNRQDNSGMKFWDIEFLAGWQFGDTADSLGALRIIPAGIGFRHYSFYRIYGISGTNDVSKSFSSYYYKGGIEYQKDKLLLDGLTLTAGVYYESALYSGTWSKGSNGSRYWGNGYGYGLKYKPSGIEAVVGVDYYFTDNFAVGAKVGYSKISDELLTNGTKLYVNDGLKATFGIKYKF